MPTVSSPPCRTWASRASLIVAMVYNASGETYIPYVELLFVCFAVRE